MNKPNVKPMTGEPFDVNQIAEVEEEIAGLVQESHDTPGKKFVRLRLPRGQAEHQLHSDGAAPGPSNHKPVVEEDAINPTHYRKHPSGIECIEITRHMNFNTGNAVKYIWRYLDKGDPVENLKKAQWYIDDEIRRLQGQR